VDKYSPCKKVGTLANYILFTGIRRDKIRDMDNLDNDPDDVLFPGKPGIIPDDVLALTPEAQQKKDLPHFDDNALKRMTDKELAAMKCEYEERSAQRVLIEHEFKRREGIPTRRIAIAAVLISAFSLIVAVIALIIK
jgi:hypothetical protein